MQTFTKLSTLQESLTSLGNDEYSSFSVVFINESIDVHHVVAIRQAVRWCDVAIVVALNNDVSLESRTVLKNLGVEALLIPSKDDLDDKEMALVVPANSLNATWMLKAILAIMPSMVVSPVAALTSWKILSLFTKQFENLFVLKEVCTPEELLTERRLVVRKSLNTVDNNITKDAETIAQRHLPSEYNIHLIAGLNNGVVSQNGANQAKYKYIACEIAGEIVTDAVIV